KETIYLDLERDSDISKLEEAELYLENYKNAMVVIDEVQRKPGLFPLLRSLIDTQRVNGRFLLLGSASPALIRKSSESLAGRIIYHQLSPFSLGEIDDAENTNRKLWLNGGYPLSFLSTDLDSSYSWRESFIKTYLEQDIPQLGIRIPSATLHRFWKMLAHFHGQLWNASQIAGSMGVSGAT
ncbi:MAG: ATP-binding protein, partial [Proteobacteria bacterium]|nr:ATP-binding protein [Pseudomonadota bacterium]